MELAIDPSLFGVAGPSTSSTGRVRQVPSLLQQQEAVRASAPTRRPLLSESESSSGSEEDDSDEVGDEDDENEEGSSSSGETASDSSGSEESGSGSSEEESEESDQAKIAKKDKGKGRALQNQQYSLPPMPQTASSSSALAGLPPLPPNMAQTQAAMLYGNLETDAETDYATDAPGGGTKKTRNNELGRLLNAIRDTSASSAPTTATSRGVLGQEWDRTMDDELEGLEAEEGHADGQGGRKARKKARGRVQMADMEPSPEVRNMLGTANLAYVQGQTKEAIDILTEVIRIEPNTRSAWYTLSTIHEELGNMDKAIQLRIVIAHLTRSNPDAWKELGAQSKELGLLEQAIYCYAQAVKADRSDVGAIWDRAMLLREAGKIRQSSTWLFKLLKMQPHSPTILRELGPMYYSLNDTSKAVQLYQAAFDHFRSLHPVPSPGQTELQGWSSIDFEYLSDFLRSLKRYKEAARVVVDGTRWLQGRIAEGTAWAAFGDDREYDLQRKVRDKWHIHPRREYEDEPTHHLDTGLRLRLGLSRLAEGRLDEARIHFGIIRQSDVADIPDLYGEIADALYDKKLWVDALEVYIEMAENDETNVPAVWIKIAQCQRHAGELQDAAESYQAVIQSEPDDLDSRLALAEIYERLDRREEALELVNEVIAKRRGTQIEGLEQSDESGSAYADSDASNDEARPGLLLHQRKKKRKAASQRRLNYGARARTLTQDEKADEERAVQEAFDRDLLKLYELDRTILQATDPLTGQIPEHLHLEWLDLAAYLVDIFRTTKALFPSDGKKRYLGGGRKSFKRKKKGLAGAEDPGVDEQAAGIAERLQASLAHDETPDDEPDANIEMHAYRGVSFDDWAQLAVRYSIMLTRIDERDEAQEVLRHMLTSSMMRQDEARNQLLYFGLVSCSLYSGDFDAALDDLRKIIASRKLESEPLKLLQAIFQSGIHSLDVYINNKFQKYLLRMIKIIDTKALPNAGTAAENDDSGDEGDATTLQAGYSGFKPTKVNPHFLMLYGHIMACGKAYQSAIVYYLRAYELRSDDPLICLSLALAYTHRAMQRQTDNRQHQLAQALAFLDGYRKNRDSDQEVEYNVARIFHQLGIVDLAAKHYEKVLQITEDSWSSPAMQVEGAPKSDNELDLSREAAYNLSSIYFTRNAPDLARQVVNRYLSM